MLSQARLVILVFAALAATTRLRAQPFFALTGTVTDSSGTPIGGASVSVLGTYSKTSTDQRGRFQLGQLSAGTVTLTVRRLGFAQATPVLSIGPGQSRDVHVTMAAVPGLLNPVVVSARRQYTGRLAGYYTRLERRAGGYFITRDEIDRKSYKNLSQLLRNIPGVNAFPLITGGSAVRMRERKCRPLVWIDGVPMPAGEVDLDAFPVSTLHGIEAYPGTTNTPQDFVANGDQACGTIVLWSRGRDTDPLLSKNAEPVDVQALVDNERVYAADQVDERATPVNPDLLSVGYPPELIQQRTSGSVLAQYVVDTTGAIESETFSIVSSSHPLFSVAVTLALKNASYHPATKAGKPVRQVILQPFEFTPSGERATQGSRPTIKQGG